MTTRHDYTLFLKSMTGTLTDSPRNKVLGTLCGNLNISLTNLTTRTDGYTLHTDKLDDLQILFTAKATKLLNNLKLTPIRPKDLDARLVLLVRKVPDFVGEHNPDELLDEIHRHNENLKLTEVIKIPDKTRFFKLRCEETRTAEKILKDGLKAFHVRIPPDNIHRLTPTHINICYHCYRLEDHFTSSCPHKNVKICSNCTGTHTHHECPTPSAQLCINCKRAGNKDFKKHHTLALRCPQRKTVTKTKQTQQLRPTTTLTPVPTPVTAANNLTATIQDALPPKTILKMAAVIVEAQTYTKNNPDEDYDTYLNESLHENFGLTIKLPKRRRKQKTPDPNSTPTKTPTTPMPTPPETSWMSSTSDPTTPPPNPPECTTPPSVSQLSENAQFFHKLAQKTLTLMQTYTDGGLKDQDIHKQYIRSLDYLESTFKKLRMYPLYNTLTFPILDEINKLHNLYPEIVDPNSPYFPAFEKHGK